MPETNSSAKIGLVRHERLGMNPYSTSLKRKLLLGVGGCLLLHFFCFFYIHIFRQIIPVENEALDFF